MQCLLIALQEYNLCFEFFFCFLPSLSLSFLHFLFCLLRSLAFVLEALNKCLKMLGSLLMVPCKLLGCSGDILIIILKSLGSGVS